jgi:endonuclease/exonuclease/phosphatase (EEP) superfamily protein YafD
VRGLGLDGGYPLVPLMAYTPYVCLLGVLVTAACGALRQWGPTALAAVAALALVLAVAPRAIGGPDREAEGRELRVMTANLRFGSGDEETLVRLARERDVDLLAVQELTFEAVAELKRSGLAGELPHAALSSREGVVGSGIYSRYPVRRRLGPGEVDFKQTRAVFSVDPALSLDVVSAHPLPPTGSAGIRTWKAGFAELPGADEPGPAHLLLGDFNATLDHDRLRQLLDTGYADAAERVGEGLKTTWPADRRWPPEITIDHLLLPEDWAVRDYEVLDLPGSDHRPVYAELVIPEG